MAREIPGWLRAVLNVIAIAGVGATLMGWVEHHLGIGILICALLYLLWEIAPWITSQLHRRPIVSLIAFIVVGAFVGAGAWGIWKNVTKTSSKPLTGPLLLDPAIEWQTPAPIFAGTPLSDKQLNAKADTDGTYVYTPDIGSILPVGTHTLALSFTPTDTTKYASATKSIYLVVNPAAIKPPTFPQKDADGLDPEDIKVVVCQTELALNKVVVPLDKFDGPAECRVRISSNSKIELKNSLLRIYMIPIDVKIDTVPPAMTLPRAGGSMDDYFYQLPITQTLVRDGDAFTIVVKLPRLPRRYEIQIKILKDDGHLLGPWNITIIPIHETDS